MQKRKRSDRSGKKYPKRQVITSNDPRKNEAFYTATDDNAPLGLRQYAAGVIQHPATKLHQVWLSTNGLDVTCLSAHHDPGFAESDLQAVKALISSGNFYDEEQTKVLFQILRQGGDEEPSALPDDIVRQIAREILRAVVDRLPDT